MDGNVFAVRVAPLLTAEEIRALRCVSADWQRLVDGTLLAYRDVFVRIKAPSIAAVRYKVAYFGHGCSRGGGHAHPCPNTKLDDFTAVLTCLRDSLTSLQWIDSIQQLTGYDMVLLLPRATLVDVAAWLVARLRSDRPSNPSVDLKHITTVACQIGCLPVVQWLAAESNLQRHSVVSSDCSLFRCVCEAGNLDIAEWLADTYRLDKLDVSCMRHLAYRKAIARWLAARFAMTKQDVLACDSYAFRWSCAHGHLAVAQWLVSHFRLSCADVSTIQNFALEWSSGPVADWLSERFSLDNKLERQAREAATRAAAAEAAAALALSREQSRLKLFVRWCRRQYCRLFASSHKL
jgi:hypothetical protein